MNLTQLESRRAVALSRLCGALASGGSYWVRLTGCGATDQVRRTPKEQIAVEPMFTG